MTVPVDPREALRKVLQENSVDDLHSWRCAYPEVYGKCSCLDDLITSILASYRPAHEVAPTEDSPEFAEAKAEAWDEGYGDVNDVVTPRKNPYRAVPPVTETPESCPLYGDRPWETPEETNNERS